MQKQCKNDVWEKSNDAYSLLTRVQTMLNHIPICFFYHKTNAKENVFFRTQAEKGIAQHIDTSIMVWHLCQITVLYHCVHMYHGCPISKKDAIDQVCKSLSTY